jgi:hypothetical protein
VDKTEHPYAHLFKDGPDESTLVNGNGNIPVFGCPTEDTHYTIAILPNRNVVRNQPSRS